MCSVNYSCDVIMSTDFLLLAVLDMTVFVTMLTFYLS